VGNGAVDFQQGIRVEQGLHLAIMATTTSKDFIHDLCLLHIITDTYNTVLIFLLPQVKNKPREGVTSSALFSGMLA
jgi:hypothetical protein